MSNKVKFRRLSYAAYRLIQQIDSNTIYFILDQPFIYLNGTEYGLQLDSSKHLVNSMVFDSDTNELVYTISGDTTLRSVPIDIKLATELNSGLMSADQVKSLNNLVSAMGDVTNVSDFVTTTVEDSSADISWIDV